MYSKQNFIDIWMEHEPITGMRRKKDMQSLEPSGDLAVWDQLKEPLITACEK